MSDPIADTPAPSAAHNTSAQATGTARGAALFDGDTGRFELPLRQALVRLLRGPYVDGTADARLWQRILDRRAQIQGFVSELFLRLVIDEDRKIALLEPVELEHPHTTAIVPRRALKREETLLALRLRLLLESHAGTGTDAVVTRAGARDILAEHRQPGTVDDKRLEELTDSSIARLLALKLLLPTQLDHEYKVSGALALALPFSSIEEIPAYLAAIERTDADAEAGGGFEEALDLEAVDPEAAEAEAATTDTATEEA
ncbi:hypothetical protein GCM10027591_15120 [Zhihengliuella somnathii]